MDLIEIQEAFAVQALADARMMGIKAEHYSRYGLETICGGGGLGIDAVVEKC